MSGAAVEDLQQVTRKSVPSQGSPEEEALLGFFNDVCCIQAPAQVLRDVNSQKGKARVLFHPFMIYEQIVMECLFFPCS